MLTVTAIYDGCEIGFGEGEKLTYSMFDCIDSISQIYKDCVDRREVALRAIYDDGRRFMCSWHDFEVAQN